MSYSLKKLQLLAIELCVCFFEAGVGEEVRGWVNSCMDVVGDGHHRFHNFDLRSSDMDGECRTVVGFSHLKGFYLICSKVGKERVMMIGIYANDYF